MRITILTPLYALAIAALLGLTACGAGTSAAPAPVAAKPPASLHTGRVLVIGGNELFDASGLVKLNLGPCADNEGLPDNDSLGMLGLLSLGVLNDYPGTVIFVANAFELTYTDRQTTLGRFATMVNDAAVTGSRVILVGVPGADDFNAELKTLARTYGAAYSDALSVNCPQ